MKKVVRTSLNNVANKRGVRDLNIQLYSHDKNNAGFEFVIKNEVDLSEYRAKVLFDFQESFATWETKGTIEGNVVKVKFDTTFITKCEEVIGYLFLDSETDTLDVFKFKFNVVLSEIDKYDTAKRGFRYIKDQEVVDVITRSELEEELKKLQINGGIDLSNYLTTSAANETFATKQELSTYATKDELPSISGLVTTEQLTTAKNSVVEEISNKGYVTSTVAEETYAKKTDLPTPYNDSALVERVANLENKTDKDTVYNDTEVKERLTTLENKPPVDLSNYATKQELANVSGSQLPVDNLVTKDELASKNYLTTHQDISNLATKEELQEVRNSQPTVDTSNLVTRQELEEKHYATEQSLNNYALKSEIPTPYNDSALVQKIGQLEARVDKDTVYDDTSLKERVTALESKAIEGGAYDDTHLRERLDTLEAKQDKDTVYDDAPLKERLVALETKVDKDTVYNDEEVKQRLTTLENKPTVDLSDYATKQELQEIKNNRPTVDTSNLVTRQELEEKHYLTEIYLNSSELAQRVSLIEVQTDKDTVYDDTALKERVTNLENKPAVDTSHFITDEILESKGFLTTHQDITNLATKEELAKTVTKEELEEKHYVTSEQVSSTYATKSEIPQPYSDTELVKRITVLENRQDNDTVYDDAELKRRVTALEERPTTSGSVDTSNLVTKDELKEKENAIYDTMAISPLYKVYTEETITEHLNSEDVLVSSGVDIRGGIIYSNASLSTADIFKGDVGKEKFVDFNTAMFTVANSIPDNYSINDLIYEGGEDKKVLFLSNKNFSQVVPKEELKAIIKEFGGTGSTGGNIDTSHFITTETLDNKNYLTATVAEETYAKKSELPAPYNDSALVSRVTALESKQDKDTVYNDTEVKQRLNALESRPTGGGSQTQDTGWITLTDNDPTNGNVIKIRRINDMVHVSVSNTGVKGVMLEVTGDNAAYLLEEKEISKGFTPMKDIVLPISPSVDDLHYLDFDSLGWVIFKIENNKVTFKTYGGGVSGGIPTEKYINDFSYFTEDPFPTNLH